MNATTKPVTTFFPTFSSNFCAFLSYLHGNLRRYNPFHMLRLLMYTLATFTEKVVEKKCRLCAICYVLCAVWFTIFESPFCNWVNVTLIYLSKSTVSVATTFGAEKGKKNRRASQFVIILVIWLGNGGLNNHHHIRNHQHWTNCCLFIFSYKYFPVFFFARSVMMVHVSHKPRMSLKLSVIYG